MKKQTILILTLLAIIGVLFYFASPGLGLKEQEAKPIKTYMKK